MTRLILALALALALPAGAMAASSPTTGSSNQMTGGTKGKPAVTCPKGKKPAADGTCVSAKSGTMGFDLAPPDENNGNSSSQSGGTRSVQGQNGHH